MAGVYIHIPFCRQLCHYCDFYKTVSLAWKGKMTDCLCRELILQREYLDQPVETIYFGGGTPTVMAPGQLKGLLHTVQDIFKGTGKQEITVEANPEDMDRGFCESLLHAGFNRISIGIQSFHEADLTLMNRRHTVEQSIYSVLNAQDAGFDNISVDLIYGLPGMTTDTWKRNVETALSLNVQHISSYYLTIEKGTIFYRWMKKGILQEQDDNEGFRQFRVMNRLAASAGFLHYEISNYALPGFQSRHNSAYWKGVPYLGIGPSANSFNGKERQWNVSHHAKYIRAIEQGIIPAEKEELTEKMLFNEAVMTGLRTSGGVDMEEICMRFGYDARQHCLKQAGKYLKNGWMIKRGGKLILTEEGMFLSDTVISDLFRE
ncbi:MAG: radical SAM family heme chaperone HemW [Bacteroidales bacterium]